MQKLSQLLLLLILPLISNAATYYVSNSGDDSNSGQSTTDAWRTIDKVNSMMPTFGPGDEILFQRGGTFYGMIEITAAGTSQNPITFGAYGSGDIPKIKGTRLLTGWTHVEGTIWQNTNCADCELVTKLFNDDLDLPLSREPNNEFLDYEGATDYSLIDNDAPYPTGTFDGALASVRTSQWTTDAVTISSQVGGTLNFSENLTYDYNTGFGYFFLNHRNAIDTENEWAHDLASGTIYYQTNYDPNNSRMEAASFESCISLVDSSNYIVIQELEVVGGRKYNIKAKGARNLTIENCKIINSGGNAIHLHESANPIIRNNLVSKSNNNGMDVDECPNMICTDNTVTRIASLSGRGWSGNGQYIGIKYYNGSGGIIKHNHIDTVGYSGIQFFKATRTYIDSNYINYSCMVNDDGGAIYGWQNSVAPGNYIRNNIITNAVGAPEATNVDYHSAHGIYVDDGGENLIIENNTVYKCRLGIFIHNSRNLKISNNTIYDNIYQLCMKKKGGYAIIDCDIKNNKLACGQLYKDKDVQYCLYEQYVDMGTNIFDSNYYVNPFRAKPIYYYTDAFSFDLTPEEWKEYDGGPNGKSSPISFSESGIEDPNDLYFFEFNNTKSAKYVTLEDSYMDFDGNIVTGTIEIPPYNSVILIKTTVELLDVSATPSGENAFCPTNETMSYSTTGTPSADTYEWRLSPEAAGSISGEGKSATVTWNENYYGDASIYYLASGSADYKAISPKLYINIFPLPEIDTIIDGQTELTRNSVNTSYSIPADDSITAYHWLLEPEIAGTLSPDWNTVTVDWNNDYTGSANIRVSGENECGVGPNSDPLLITIVETDPTFGVKKAFTPNFDGINDLWDLPFVNDYPEATIKIYDRANRLIIEYTGSDPGWNGGDSSGNLVPRGNYLYVIDLKNGTKPLVGYVSVIH